MLGPPQVNRRRSSWRDSILLVAGVVAAIAVSMSLLVVAGFLILPSLIGWPRPAPADWQTISPKMPPDATLVGIWRPADPGRTIPFRDGTRHTLAADDTLVLLANHTYRFTRQGIYDGNSKLICLRSETGQWSVQPQPGKNPTVISLVANLPSISIEHRVIPDLNMDKEFYDSIKREQEDPAHPAPQLSDTEIVDQDNAMNCSSSAPRDLMISDWKLAQLHGRLGLYRDAPALPYQDPSATYKNVPIAQLLYQKDGL